MADDADHRCTHYAAGTQRRQLFPRRRTLRSQLCRRSNKEEHQQSATLADAEHQLTRSLVFHSLFAALCAVVLTFTGVSIWAYNTPFDPPPPPTAEELAEKA